MEDNVVEETNTPVEGAPKVTEPETPKTPETPAPEEHDNTRELIAELSGKVDALATTVSELVSGSGHEDSSPVKPPWTHRKIF